MSVNIYNKATDTLMRVAGDSQDFRIVRLTQSEYDILEYADTHMNNRLYSTTDTNKMYYKDEIVSEMGGVSIDDDTPSGVTVYSSEKINSLLGTQATFSLSGTTLNITTL